jgi:hypothetical protein
MNDYVKFDQWTKDVRVATEEIDNYIVWKKKFRSSSGGCSYSMSHRLFRDQEHRHIVNLVREENFESPKFEFSVLSTDQMLKAEIEEKFKHLIDPLKLLATEVEEEINIVAMNKKLQQVP